jgi:predicted TIM-barrel fold metal-dependent hydrolase
MAANNIRKAILSVTAPGVPIVLDIEGGRALAREINEYSAELREAQPDSFGFFASLPSLLDTEGTVTEIEYALDVLKADGVTLFTRYGNGSNSHYLGHASFDPIWSALDARNAVVFIHPTHQVNATPISPLLLQPLIDYPHETTRAAVDMIASNVTRRFPNVKCILSHAGGTLPYLISRISTSSNESEVLLAGKTGAEIREDFRTFYFDLALSSDSAVLDMLLTLVPHERIVYGAWALPRFLLSRSPFLFLSPMGRAMWFVGSKTGVIDVDIYIQDPTSHMPGRRLLRALMRIWMRMILASRG